MEIQQIPKVIVFIDIASRRKAFISGLILLALTVGLGVYLSIPKVFESSSLLSFEQNIVNTSKNGRMTPDDSSKLKDVVGTLSQIVTSRTSLEKIITDEKLFINKRSSMPMQDIVDQMRQNIRILPSKDGSTFVVSYQGDNAEKVARVTNILAGRFIEENMKFRQERASQTTEYTKDELQLAKQLLDKKEEVMRDYKLAHYNELPEQREANTTRLIALQTQYQNQQESIQNYERTRALLNDQLSYRKESLSNDPGNSDPASVEKTKAMTPRQALQALSDQLKFLKLRYKDEHPRIISLKNKIAKLEKELGGNSGSTTETTEGNTIGASSDKMVVGLDLQLKDVQLRIQKETKEKEETQKKIDQYEKWISATPIREAEWSSLTREYAELKNHYDFLVAQNLQAESALNLERKQQGSQFKIEDSAQVPTKPVKPDFFKTLGIALFIGCALSVGGALVGEKLNTTFRFPQQLEDSFGFEILCSVPRVVLRRELLKKRIWTAVGSVFFISWFLALTACGAFLYIKGYILV